MENSKRVQEKRTTDPACFALDPIWSIKHGATQFGRPCSTTDISGELAGKSKLIAVTQFLLMTCPVTLKYTITIIDDMAKCMLIESKFDDE